MMLDDLPRQARDFVVSLSKRGALQPQPMRLALARVHEANRVWVVRYLYTERERLIAEVDRLSGLLNTPELNDFADGVVLEAAHQRERWGVEHDSEKTHADWFWLVGYLAGKALSSALSGDVDKAMHHTISTSAALANWHETLRGDAQ